VILRPTKWRIVVSTAERSLSVYRRGRLVRRVPVVVGKPGTPTPEGLFSIIGAWPSAPNAFLGSWILPLTAHSNVLQQFDGGDGTVGIHGRGGASLLDPLGSASSHGCIRRRPRSLVGRQLHEVVGHRRDHGVCTPRVVARALAAALQTRYGSL
jgi:lipoprotein-anchoring transpeptidase ErfK/SrfK